MKVKEVSKIGQMNALEVLAGERPERAAVIALNATQKSPKWRFFGKMNKETIVWLKL